MLVETFDADTEFEKKRIIAKTRNYLLTPFVLKYFNSFLCKTNQRFFQF